jgi:putative exosortase-associated protein (TIGR04073 family)
MAPLVLAMLLTTAPPAIGDEAAQPSAPQPSASSQNQAIAGYPGLVAAKLLRGLANLSTGWLELPKQIARVGGSRGWLIGSTRGSIEGLGMLTARTLAGAYEVLTFPIPVPPRFQPLLQPEYVWEEER